MNARQTRKFEAYRTTLEVLRDAPANHGVIALASRVAQLEAKIAQINELGRKQTALTKTSTVQSDERLAVAVNTALTVAAFVGAFAAEHGDPELRSLVNLSERDFTRCRKVQRATLASRVLEAAERVQAQLVAYGMTATLLADLRTQIEDARAAVGLPRAAIAVKRGATLRLAVIMAETDALLNEQIDRLMYPLRHTHSHFHTIYQAARKVHRAPRSPRAAA